MAGHSVSLLWQSKRARFANARVSGESYVGSPDTGGLVWRGRTGPVAELDVARVSASGGYDE